VRVATLRDSLRMLKEAGLPVAKILDVGVQHATPPLIEAFPDKPHFLFEPIDDYFSHIHSNYAALDYRIVEAAVSDRDGETFFHSEKKNRGAEISHSWIVDRPTDASRSVKTIRLDTYLEEHGQEGPYLLKIDVEGPNVPSSILQGALRTLTQSSAVVIEMTVDRFMQRASILHDAGFDLWDSVDHCYYGGCLWQFDAVFINRKLKDEIPSFRPMHSKPFRRELWQQG
jgi:FkbM family methyltransferase